MVSKTREKLIEVARQLFARKGLENTTINDIAEASDKGRRTVYTYFKNKSEIYDAVIESQGNQILNNISTKLNEEQVLPQDRLYNALLYYFQVLMFRNAKNIRHRILAIPRKNHNLIQENMSKITALFSGFMQRGVSARVFDSKNIAPVLVLIKNLSYYYYGNAPQDTMGLAETETELKSVVSLIVESVTIR